MKLRWRQHEIIFATIIAIITLGGYLWHVYNLSPGQINTGFAAPFIQNHIPFNFYRNMVLPQVGAGLLIYLAYLFVNFFTIPRLLFPKKFQAGTSKISVSLKKISLQGMARKVLQNFLWLIIQIVLIIFLLGVGLNISEYFINECYFSYRGFTFFPGNGSHPQPLMGLENAFLSAFAMVGFYALYVCIREAIINFIERPGNKKNYRVLICNQITLFTVEYLLIPFFLISFNFIGSYTSFFAYFFIVPSLLLMFMSNLYWLLPFKKENSFIYRPVLIRLLLTAFLCSLPFLFIVHTMYLFGFIFSMAVQLFIITPISWLVYQKRKDEIQLLHGAEKAIAKSKTDLQFLRSQINPHFLFNVLNTLYGTALQENAERTANGIQKLGDMMRFMLHENNQDFIPMNREIEYLKNYISLQKLRTQSSPEIIIEDNINEQNCNHKIAPMLLIPFVENAFKHGISLKEKSWIKINLDCDEKNIIFEVHNSVHTKQDNDPEKERSGIGFKNVIERLKLLYGGKFQASVNRNEKEFFIKLCIQP
jgi:histidine kinase/GHKL domain-containing protein